MGLMDYTAVELGKKIKAGEVSVLEAANAAMDAINALEENFNCYVTVQEREAIQAKAEELQKKIDDGILTGPLAGVPVAVKDNMCTKGTRTTCSSKILENFEPTYTAEAVLNLEKAGALIIGKTNMDEFAMGSTTETSHYGVTKNPWNAEHVPGGSSGGSAAAVAAGECSYALGSDTGGSIRQPASYCGIVGMKPTYGTVSRYGLIAYGSSLDQIGPMAKDVTDCATILETIASYDPKDSTSVKREDYDFTSALTEDVKGMRIGIPKDYMGEGLDEEVKAAVLLAAKKLEEKGAIVEEFDLSLAEYAIRAYYVIASAEASSNLARFEWTDLGPVSVSLEIERKISNSLIRQKITFYADSAVIRFDTYVDWKEHQHLLKVHFPVDLHTDEATFDIQFGNLTRKIHRNTSWDEARFESCGQKWMDMSEGHYGVSMLNDCKYGHSALDGVMTLTLIKSGIEPNPTADQEEHTFTYALYPHAEGWRQAKTVQEAMKLNQPALSAEGGCAGDETSFVWIDKQNVIIETVKEAEDGDGVIIRLYESENARTKAHISFEKPVASVESCDCVEKTKETVCVAGDGFDITIKPYEIQTYRVRF